MSEPPFDLVISADWVVCADPAGTVIDDAAIGVRNGAIARIAPRAELDAEPANQRLHRPGHALLPGLVNAHGHAAMTLLRGAADDLPLHAWLNDRIWPLEGALADADFVRDGTRLAMAEMLLSGTTCFSDMYFFAETAAAAALEAGMRMQVAVPVIDFPNRWSRDAAEGVHRALELRDAMRDAPLVQVAFGPHSPYVVARPQLERIATYAHELDMAVHIHLSETATEVGASHADHGRSPVQYLADVGLLAPNLQAVHAVHVNADEINLLAANGASVVHCPASNLKLGSGVCPVPEYLRAGVALAIGTDGAAANNTLDMFRETALAALLAKGASGQADVLDASAALHLATLGGARVLGLQDQIGSLEAGKRADFIAVDLRAPRHQPVHNVVSQLVHTNCGADVTDVWVNGRQLVDGRQLTTLDADELRHAAAGWTDRVDAIDRAATRAQSS